MSFSSWLPCALAALAPMLSPMMSSGFSISLSDHLERRKDN